MVEEKHVLAYLLSQYDPDLLGKYTTEDFVTPTAQLLFHFVQQYASRYNSVPSVDAVITYLDELKEVRQFHSAEIDWVKDVFDLASRKWSEADVKYFRDKSFEYLRKRRVDKALRLARDFLREGNVDRALTVLETTDVPVPDDELHVGFDFDIVTSQEKIPTPFPTVNFITRGGIDKKTLNVIMAVPKLGKSYILIALGAHALRQGKNVLHVTLEMPRRSVIARYRAALSDPPVTVRDVLAGVPHRLLGSLGQIVVVDASTLRCTPRYVNGLFSDVKKRIGAVDVVIIDYANLMRSSVRTESSYDRIGSVYADLHSIAVEQDVVVWTVCRTNRLALDRAKVRVNYVGDSYAILYNCDSLFGLSLRSDDTPAPKRVIPCSVLYFRDYSSGHQFYVEIDYEYCRIKETSHMPVEPVRVVEDYDAS